MESDGSTCTQNPSIESHLNLVHISTPYIYRIHFNIVHLLCLGLPSGLFTRAPDLVTDTILMKLIS